MHAALLHHDGYDPSQLASHTVKRAQVKDMQVLRELSSLLANMNRHHHIQAATAAVPPPPSQLQPPIQPTLLSPTRSQQYSSTAGGDATDTSISTKSLRSALPQMADPAILSVCHSLLHKHHLFGVACDSWMSELRVI